MGGDGSDNPVEISFEDLKKMPAVEVIAVNQCSGTDVVYRSRMWSASNGVTVRWAARDGKVRGSRMSSTRLGLKKEAIEISFNGADGPAVDKTPDFIKEHSRLEGD